MKLKGLLLAVGMVVLPAVSYSATITNAEMSATTCFACHGPEGKYVGGTIPPLAGYPASVMETQLLAYKNGTRQGTVMKRHMKGYTDQEIKDIANYFGTLKP
ncbi:MAG: cytochrome c [Pseudomonadota bacterium]|nr:cytochrome c [Pseudomonadota bacterium]